MRGAGGGGAYLPCSHFIGQHWSHGHVTASEAGNPVLRSQRETGFTGDDASCHHWVDSGQLALLLRKKKWSLVPRWNPRQEQEEKQGSAWCQGLH